MKTINQYFLLAACAFGLVALSPKVALADGTAPATTVANTNGVPDLLKTCPVSGDKLGTDMGDPYVFSYQGQEVKLCCKDCKKDFDKDPAKYIKLIRAADKQ